MTPEMEVEEAATALENRPVDAAGQPLPLPLSKGEAETWVIINLHDGHTRGNLARVVDGATIDKIRSHVDSDAALLVVLANWEVARRALDEFQGCDAVTAP